MTNNSLRKPARVLAAVAGIMLLLLVFSCNKSSSGLVGKWYNVKVPEIAEFKQDGTGSFSYPNNQNPPLVFNWKKAADNSYSIDVTYMGGKRTLTGKLEGKSLNIESNVGIEVYNKKAAD